MEVGEMTEMIEMKDHKADHKGCYIHPTSEIDENVMIGDDTKVWNFCHIQSHAVIGRACTVGQNVNISEGVKIGSHVKIQNNVSVYSGVEIEDYVFCGPSCVFTNDTNPRSRYPKGKDHYKKTLIREGASIGANATIVCGHTVGRCAFVGAGAVVAGNVPDYALVAGVPARQIGWVCECGEKLAEDLVCAACSRRYKKCDKGLKEYDGK